MWNKKCLGNYFRNKDNDCIPCDDFDSEEDVTEFQCLKCDNREMITTKYIGEVCALKVCPSGTKRDEDGNCL